MKISMRFVSVTASVLAVATLTACVAPAPVYQTSPRSGRRAPVPRMP